MSLQMGDMDSIREERARNRNKLQPGKNGRSRGKSAPPPVRDKPMSSEEKIREQNDQLESIHALTKNLNSMALDINMELKTQGRLLTGVEEKIDETDFRFKKQDVRMRKL